MIFLNILYPVILKLLIIVKVLLLNNLLPFMKSIRYQRSLILITYYTLFILKLDPLIFYSSHTVDIYTDTIKSDIPKYIVE